MQLQRLPFFQLNYPGLATEPILQGLPRFLQGLSPHVSAPIGMRLAVAVGTEHPKVLQPVVVTDAIDVVDVY